MTARKPEHLGQAEPAEVAEVDGPRVDEDGLDVEDDEEDRRQVELHRQLDVPAARLSLPHSKGGVLLGVGFLLRPRNVAAP